jgi:hypothetical protein
VSHLLFVDDSLIFINANWVSARRLDEILQIYDEASSQCVNKGKSAMFFSLCTSDSQSVKYELNVQVEAFSERYLGSLRQQVVRLVMNLNTLLKVREEV